VGALGKGNNMLFNTGEFKLHSGEKSNYKIDCDALSEEDINNLAFMIAEKTYFGKVYAIPQGGLRLAYALSFYENRSGPILIADDVLTTGGSMEKAKKLFPGKEVKGVVIFARCTPPNWVRAVFTYTL